MGKSINLSGIWREYLPNDYFGKFELSVIHLPIQKYFFLLRTWQKKQNWIVKKTKDNNGNLKRIEKRNILYYSEQDFSFTKSDIVKDWNYKYKRFNGQRVSIAFYGSLQKFISKTEKRSHSG